MKTLNIFFLLVIVLLVSNAVSAQEKVFSYDTKNCKFSQIVPENKGAEWEKTSKSGYTPLSENSKMHQVAEKCSGMYLQLGVGAGYTQVNQEISSGNFEKKNEISPRAEIIFGKDFCFGHKDGGSPRNFGMAVEIKAQLTKIPELRYEDLTYVKSGMVSTFGANLVFHFTKHQPWQVSAFGGAGYTRLTSYYPNANEKSLDRLRHNTLSYEAGVQIVKRLKIGQSIGFKIGYEHTQTNMLGRGQFFVSAVWKIKKAHKSHTMTYGDYYRATH